MAPWRRALLVLLAAVLIWAIVVTWGSIGSVVLVFGLITMGAALLYKRFLLRDDPDFYE